MTFFPLCVPPPDVVDSEPNGDVAPVGAAAWADGLCPESPRRAHRGAAIHRGHGGAERRAAARWGFENREDFQIFELRTHMHFGTHYSK